MKYPRARDGGARFGSVALLGAIAGCVPNYFHDVATRAAAADLVCARPVVVRLGAAAYRVDGCGPRAFYRCSYGRHPASMHQCCTRVRSESEARAVVAFEGPDTPPATCVQY